MQVARFELLVDATSTWPWALTIAQLTWPTMLVATTDCVVTPGFSTTAFYQGSATLNSVWG